MKQKLDLVQRVDHIKKACAGKKVLHLGCTNWPYTQEAMDNGGLLHLELQSIASELSGFDFDQEGLDFLSGKGVDRLYRADLEKLDEVPLNETFDVIVAGEMIEHLNNPGLFLHGIKRFMGPQSVLLITTINAYCGMRSLYYGLRGRGGSMELVHPDHVAYYSYSTLRLLVQRAGFEVENFMFYDIGKEHRATTPWFMLAANDLCVAISPQLADGVIAECKLAANNGKLD